VSGAFISYSRVDRALAYRIVGGLRRLGVDVWWDEDMPGVDWQLELQRKIAELGAVVVLWSPASTESKNVRDEARLGLANDKLVNVLAGVIEPPFPFDRVNGLDLGDWRGEEATPGWMRLVRTLEPMVGEAGALSAAQSQRDRAIADHRAAVTAAESAYAAAQARVRDSAEAEDEAAHALRRGEKRLQTVLETRAESELVRGAQADVAALRTRHEAADAAHETARRGLSDASRALTAAKTALRDLIDETPPAHHAPSSATVAPTARPTPPPQPTRPAGSAGLADVPAAGAPMKEWVEYGERVAAGAASRKAAAAAKRLAQKAARAERRRSRPVISVGGIIALSIVGWIIWNQVNKPQQRVAPPPAAVEAALAVTPCAWLDVKAVQREGRSGLMVTGAAGDTAAAASPLLGSAKASVSRAMDLDLTSIRSLDSRLCDVVGALNERRRSPLTETPTLRLTTDEDRPGEVRARIRPGDGEFAVLALRTNGDIDVVPAAADRRPATAAKDLLAMALISGQGPFEEAVIAGKAGARGPAWVKRFQTAAAAGGWRTALAWYAPDTKYDDMGD